MKDTEERIVKIRDWQIPMRIVREARPNMRVSLGKRMVIVRLPKSAWLLNPSPDMQKVYAWLEHLAEAKPAALARLAIKTYQSGDLITVGSRRYQLHISYEDRQTHHGSLRNGHLALRLSQHEEGKVLQTSIQHLISRLVAQDFLPAISRRVAELNHLFFQQPIKSVRLKYNHSNWGSCSSSGNINLSTRLLFAPAAVIDYVIIHELAHRIEMNHSDRFWALVAAAMPDYEQHEQWLKVNGSEIDF